MITNNIRGHSEATPNKSLDQFEPSIPIHLPGDPTGIPANHFLTLRVPDASSFLAALRAALECCALAQLWISKPLPTIAISSNRFVFVLIRVRSWSALFSPRSLCISLCGLCVTLSLPPVLTASFHDFHAKIL